MPASFAPLRLCAFALIAFLSFNLRAEEAPKFLGAQSCSTSGCHGGADDKSRQYTVWVKYDVHHERPFATLTTARSERLAETLKISDPTQSARCTVCHAPMQTVPAERRADAVKISDGVSCENCHGPAENWIRSHTRKDYTHADRINAGMRDLQNLYVRANTCVACHQNVDADILLSRILSVSGSRSLKTRRQFVLPLKRCAESENSWLMKTSSSGTSNRPSSKAISFKTELRGCGS